MLSQSRPFLVTSAAVLFASVALSFSPDALRAQDPAPACTPVDASLDSMLGHRHLAEERGRVVVLFYEDRDHIYDNDALKIEMARYLIDNHLEDRLVLYGVANLGDVGSVPESLVRGLIQPAIDRWGGDILLDWEGLMRRPPFSFATGAANVAILDRAGCILWRHSGALDEERRRDFFRTLRRAIR
jgi:hypothetical protein